MGINLTPHALWIQNLKFRINAFIISQPLNQLNLMHQRLSLNCDEENYEYRYT